VLSEFATKWPDLESVPGRATKDRVAIGEGHGRDILGHPFNSVAWLATQLASRGVGLKARQVVMTGSVMKTVFPDEDANYRFEPRANRLCRGASHGGKKRSSMIRLRRAALAQSGNGVLPSTRN